MKTLFRYKERPFPHPPSPREKRYFSRLIFRICQTLVLPTFATLIAPVAATNAATTGLTPWKVIVQSELANLDPYKTSLLEFQIVITDEKTKQTLRTPNYQLTVLAALVSNVSKPNNNSTINSQDNTVYLCHRPRPKSILAGNIGGSALSSIRTESNERGDIILNYQCWFPMGMKSESHSLFIRGNVVRDGTYLGVDDPQANQQIFIAGKSYRKIPDWLFYSQDPSKFVTTILTDKDILVISPTNSLKAEKSFNSSSLQNTTMSLKQLQVQRSKQEREYRSNLETVFKKLEELELSVKSLQKQRLSNANTSKLKDWVKEMEDLKKDASVLLNVIDSTRPGSPSDDLFEDFLRSYRFDGNNSPKILSVSIPNFSQILDSPTPYLRVQTYSARPIVSANFWLGTKGSWSFFPFAGNVLIPGMKPEYSLWGGGLVLIESQTWDGKGYQTNLLVGSSVEKMNLDQISITRTAFAVCGFVVEASGGNSEIWNWNTTITTGLSQQCEKLPMADSGITNSSEFDRLKKIYLDLAIANQDLQAEKQLPSEQLSKIAVLSTALKALEKSIEDTRKIVSLSNNIDKEKKITIFCAKGKITKKVTGLNPKCPKGFKRK